MLKPDQILKDYFGYEQFRGLQKEVINTLLEDGEHTLVLMPTGSGKSITYQIPALCFDGGTLVISPLIALMQDQVDALIKKNIPAAFINSTVSKSTREKKLSEFVSGKFKMLYVTPERFRKEEFVEQIKNADISLLAVDEAHCISEWGHDFRPDYSRIGEFRELIGDPLTIALTATATKNVQADIIRKLNLKKENIKVFHQGIERPNLRLEIKDVYGDENKLDVMMQVLNTYKGSGIIYFALIKTLDQFSGYLDSKKISHLTYHGKLNAKDRKAIQRKFISGKNQLLLGTNAFGMGIDKPDIRFIIHAEIPSSVESYYQEIGRAGRDGEASLCLLLYDQNDLFTQMEFIKWANPSAEYYHRVYEILNMNMEKVNSFGIDYLREELSFKDKNDFRLETTLAMLDRYAVIEGDIEKKNIKLVKSLPAPLEDESHLSEKLLNDNKKLLAMVNYFKEPECRRIYISDYFGFTDEPACGNCDGCDKSS